LKVACLHHIRQDSSGSGIIYGVFAHMPLGISDRNSTLNTVR